MKVCVSLFNSSGLKSPSFHQPPATVIEDQEDISSADDEKADTKLGDDGQNDGEVPDDGNKKTSEESQETSENDSSFSGDCDLEINKGTTLRGWEETDQEVKVDEVDKHRKSEDEEVPEDEVKEVDKDDRDRCTEMKNKNKEGKNNGADKDAQNVQAVTSKVYIVVQDIGTNLDRQIGVETNKKSLESQAEVQNMDMCFQQQGQDGFSINEETMVDNTEDHTDVSPATVSLRSNREKTESAGRREWSKELSKVKRSQTKRSQGVKETESSWRKTL